MQNQFTSCTEDQTLLVKLGQYGKTLCCLLPGSTFSRSSNTQFRKWKDSNSVSKIHQSQKQSKVMYFLPSFVSFYVRDVLKAPNASYDSDKRY